ncbi:MAG: DUF6259 domain-containing protein, partial [Pirellulales bacterium]
GAVTAESIRAVDAGDGSAIPFEFVPTADFDAENHITGTVVAQLPQGGDRRLRLTFDSPATPPAGPWQGTVATPWFSVIHDPARQGGLPASITFSKTGKQFDSFRWNDRVYDRQQGWFGLANDPQPSVRRVADGPLCSVVRVRAKYTDSGGKRPASQPEAVYDWYYFHDRPQVLVRAATSQREPFAWPEHHFLELNYPRQAFPRWAGGEPEKSGELTGSKESLRFSRWAAVSDGANAIGMLGCGQALVYDGGGGTYLHAHGAAAWTGWHALRPEFSAWLWIGSGDDPVATVRAAGEKLPTRVRAMPTVDEIHARIEAARGGQGPWWGACGAATLEAQGRLAEAAEAAEGNLPSTWQVIESPPLGLVLERAGGGIRVVNLYHSPTGQALLGPKSPPLFDLTLRDARSKEKEEVHLMADAGWKRVEVVPADGRAKPATLRWKTPGDKRFGGLSVEVTVRPDNHAFRWTLKVDNPGDAWSVWRVVFPQLAVADLGPEGRVFVPRAAGGVTQDPWRQSFRFTGNYSSGWASMPFLAAYNRPHATGLYVAVHDPWGGTKEIKAESRPADRTVLFSFDHPAADMGRPGNDFELSGEVVLAWLPGDWFDAAMIYRDWVRRKAAWYPKLGEQGREDTPSWMRSLSVWALASGKPEQIVPTVKEFQKYLGVPLGVHWYNWHQIPFDNDYPHYFPTKEGFADAVRRLRESQIFVMPYINGRLWDTRDRGLEDFQFSKLARAAATKDELGQPYVEKYGSKESDGSRVALAVMCPTTRVWRDQLRQIVLRLFNECGTSGVYIDQIAAARPRLCFDPAHGHPLGGGHWWTRDGYWPLMERIRQAMPDDRMLTTECNAEPYVRWFDGYLTWHWQDDGQVPAFPAVYGGAIQMFGRAYRGGPSKDLALRMKAGQQLVFGEQIGWIAPSVVQEKENAEFLRRVVRLRARLVRYFYAGEMARPPELAGDLPTVTADWQWSGQWLVTTSAVMTGAWRLPRQNRAVLLFVNVGDEPVTAGLKLDLGDYGLPGPKSTVTKITPETAEDAFVTPPLLDRELTFPPRTAWAWEIKPQ